MGQALNSWHEDNNNMSPTANTASCLRRQETVSPLNNLKLPISPALPFLNSFFWLKSSNVNTEAAPYLTINNWQPFQWPGNSLGTLSGLFRHCFDMRSYLGDPRPLTRRWRGSSHCWRSRRTRCRSLRRASWAENRILIKQEKLQLFQELSEKKK